MVGYTLRQERERQGLTVNDIEQGTSIRALYIEAIENGEYDKLPGAIYTKGFIKNYAKFLGMDADAVAKEFTADMAELKAEQEAEEAKVAAEAQAAGETEIKPPTKNNPEKKLLGHSIGERNRSSSGLLIVAAVVLIAALAGAAWSFLSTPDGEVAQVSPPVEKVQTATPEPVPAENPAPPVAEPVANAAPQPSDTLNIQARFSNRCWVLVTVDGAVVQEGIFDNGQTLSWEGKEQINFRLGNAGAVEFFRDGKSLGVPGAEGEIVEKTFTRQ